jgi:hypothetical protein
MGQKPHTKKPDEDMQRSRDTRDHQRCEEPRAWLPEGLPGSIVGGTLHGKPRDGTKTQRELLSSSMKESLASILSELPMVRNTPLML